MTQSIESMIEVLQAYQAGKEIEFSRNDGKTWTEIGSPSWNFDIAQYRIAPKPKKVKYLCFNIGGELRWVKYTETHPADWIRVPSEDKEIEI